MLQLKLRLSDYKTIQNSFSRKHYIHTFRNETEFYSSASSSGTEFHGLIYPYFELKVIFFGNPNCKWKLKLRPSDYMKIPPFFSVSISIKNIAAAPTKKLKEKEFERPH